VRIETLTVGPLQVNCYLVQSLSTGDAVIIDPGGDAERILEAVRRSKATVRLIINTHGHFDHIGANALVATATGAPLALHERDATLLSGARDHAASFGLTAEPSPPPDILLKGGETLNAGGLEFRVIPLPGHSPGSICLLSGNHLFSGDALFAGSVGRTDLPGGSHEQLVRGIRERLFCLPDETLVHPGHGPATTIGREKRSNPFAGMNASWT